MITVKPKSLAKTDAKKIPSVFCYLAAALLVLTSTLFSGCSDFLEPVKATDTPTEYEFNYWLLKSTYLFEDELDKLPENGDSVSQLYSVLNDKYTRYVAPSNSESTQTSMNTSIVEGDVGMEYMYLLDSYYPLCIKRVYYNGPAGQAGIQKYGIISRINGVELVGDQAYNIYKSILDTSRIVELDIIQNSDTTRFTLTKETIYAPTVFVDTLFGAIFVNITEFKPNTANHDQGTYGELKAYLDSTSGTAIPRIIDIRNNPGGHVSQCTSIADLFVGKGKITTQHWKTFAPDGKGEHRSKTFTARAGDPGENGKFLLLMNKNSASCSEIFTAALMDGAGIPSVGDSTFGKGIGQTTWKTISNGLSIITSLEFIPPSGNVYNKKGIAPQYTCGNEDLRICAAKKLNQIYGNSLSKAKANSFDENPMILDILPAKKAPGGAIVPGESLHEE